MTRKGFIQQTWYHGVSTSLHDTPRRRRRGRGSKFFDGGNDGRIDHLFFFDFFSLLIYWCFKTKFLNNKSLSSLEKQAQERLKHLRSEELLRA